MSRVVKTLILKNLFQVRNTLILDMSEEEQKEMWI